MNLCESLYESFPFRKAIQLDSGDGSTGAGGHSWPSCALRIGNWAMQWMQTSMLRMVSNRLAQATKVGVDRREEPLPNSGEADARKVYMMTLVGDIVNSSPVTNQNHHEVVSSAISSAACI